MLATLASIKSTTTCATGPSDAGRSAHDANARTAGKRAQTDPSLALATAARREGGRDAGQPTTQSYARVGKGSQSCATRAARGPRSPCARGVALPHPRNSPTETSKHARRTAAAYDPEA